MVNAYARGNFALPRRRLCAQVADSVVPGAGFSFRLVHVQPHTVPASSMAHVEADSHMAFDRQGGKLAPTAYDTETKLDKEQVMKRLVKEVCMQCCLQGALTVSAAQEAFTALRHAGL